MPTKMGAKWGAIVGRRGATWNLVTAEYPTVTVAGVRAAAAYGAALAREDLLPLPQSR